MEFYLQLMILLLINVLIYLQIFSFVLLYFLLMIFLKKNCKFLFLLFFSSFYSIFILYIFQMMLNFLYLIIHICLFLKEENFIHWRKKMELSLFFQLKSTGKIPFKLFKYGFLCKGIFFFSFIIILLHNFCLSNKILFLNYY